MYTANVLRFDEDGPLARRTEFMKTCIDLLHVVVQTTGGYNSENNGMVESPIKPVQRMIQSFLIGPTVPYILWCFAFTQAIYPLNHRYNRLIDNLSIVQWNYGNYELHTIYLFVFGSNVYSVTKSETKKQLPVTGKNIKRS